ncbi:TRAP transporter permease [Azospirillum sp. ST 5-10]|uniref:TRAP transporter permease n=1 Tax=unclassified Azospirillum TaxID=2630922 RepID=UPI003F49F8DC
MSETDVQRPDDATAGRLDGSALRALAQSPRALAVWALALLLAGFHLHTATYGIAAPYTQRGTHLLGLLLICYAMGMGHDGRGRSLARLSDLVLFAATAAVAAYLWFAFDPRLVLERGIAGPTRADLVVGVLLMALVLEGTRRSVGLPIVLVAVAFLLYGLAGPYMPDIISHRGYSLDRLTTYLVWSTSGIFGTPVAVSATFVILFIMLGALMDKLGAGALFIDLAVALTGRLRGGPALTAVVGSALMGSVNGSSVSNVVTTGTFTIPLMRRTGYRPEFAAGVEAVASTGGQIMPPIMGAGAFVMAEMLGVSYASVALMALIPALLYFLSIGLMVYFEARRLDMPRLDRDALPDVRQVLARGFHLLLPLALLIYALVFAHLSPIIAGVVAIVSLVGIASLATLLRERRLPWREVLEALRLGVVTAVPVALACASAGIVIGVISMTGLGVRFTQIIIDLSSGMLWLGAILTMIACIVLGMGLPTTAAYIITAVLGAPALAKLGVPLVSAHMFIFYFAIVSFITPPVGLSSYAAAGVARTNPITTSVVAFKLGIAGFIVPYVILYSPAILLQGSPWAIAVVSLTAVLGVTALAAAIVGWFLVPLNGLLRVLFALGAVALIHPDPVYALAGVIPMLGVLASRAVGRKGRSTAPARP